MKKILCGIIAAAMAVSCCACSGNDYSEYGDSAVLEAEKVTAKAGDTVEVEIYLNNNPGTSTVGVELTYDTSVLTAVSAKSSGKLEDKGMFFPNVSGEHVDALWANAYDFDGNGEVMTITFEVAEDAAAGEYALTFVENEDDLTNEDLEYVDTVYLGGSVTIS